MVSVFQFFMAYGTYSPCLLSKALWTAISCVFLFQSREKYFGQKEHLNGFSLVCLHSWLASLVLLENSFAQNEQLYFFLANMSCTNTWCKPDDVFWWACTWLKIFLAAASNFCSAYIYQQNMLHDKEKPG